MGSRIIFLRHGQTAANIKRELDSRPPGSPLTAHGQQQATAAGEALARHLQVTEGQLGRLGKIVHSTATRARQTANLAAESLANSVGLSVIPTPPEEIAGIHEFSAGIYEDSTTEEAYRAYIGAFQRIMRGDDSAGVPGGETGAEFLDRYLPALETQFDTLEPDQDLVVVSHGAAIRMITERATGTEPRHMVENYLDNCDISIVEPEGRPFGQWNLRYWVSDELLTQPWIKQR
ncbi:histidine phosphatase family protein [Corynebacterium choanae]|uniref:histidine phosphatase family protein n=1 Tax=Corynebacterium choanae TaxID=1862358 RepID=UPI00360B9EAE